MRVGSCIILFWFSTFVAQSASGLPRPIEQNYPRDAQGFLVQPQVFAVAGLENGVVHYLQFSVSGSADRPYLLTLSSYTQPDDVWPTRLKESKPESRVGFPFSPLNREREGPLAWVSLSTNQIGMLSAALEKSWKWAEISNREKLAVEAKELVHFTNSLTVSFSKFKDSTNFTLRVWLPTATYGNFPLARGITIDRQGIARMAAIISTLPIRRQKFLDFEERDQREELERNEIRKREKARIDELLR